VELCVKHNLKKGIDIDENFLQEIVFEDEKTKAMNKAVNYLSSNLKTAKQIRDYLKKKEYSQATIDYVIDKMKEYKYLDDESYARAIINTYSNKYGKMKLKSALRSKGIKDDIIESVLSEDLKIESSLSKVAEKYLRNKDINRETLNKLSRFLYSRGYEFDEINSYISALLKNK
jgi:regulatory protein